MNAFSRADTSLVGDWWWTIDRWLLASILLLLAFGFLMTFAASPAVAIRLDAGPYHFVINQLIFVGPSLIIMFAASLTPADMLGRLAVPCLVVALFALGFASGWGPELNGARRWLSFAGFSLQPIEFVKPLFIVASAWLLSERLRNPEFPGGKLSAALLAIVIGLLVMQPDFGQSVLVTAIWSVQVFLAGLPLIWTVALGALGVSGVVGAYYLLPHVASRIDRFLHPAGGDTFQVDTATDAFVRGGAFGQGPGEGQVKNILPDAHSDYIFAVIGEEYGLFACLLVLSVFAYVVVRGFNRVAMERDLFVVLALAGLLTQFAIQTIVNVGVNLNLLPSTGMTLPFVSYGGSSLLGIALGMGMVLSLTRKQPGPMLTA